jgi:hypothetical protein
MSSIGVPGQESALLDYEAVLKSGADFDGVVVITRDRGQYVR